MFNRTQILFVSFISIAALLVSCNDKGAELRNFYVSQSHDKRLIGKWILLPNWIYRQESMEYFEFKDDGRFNIYEMDLKKNKLSKIGPYQNYWYSKEILISSDSSMNLLYEMNYGGNFKFSYLEHGPIIYKIHSDTLYYKYADAMGQESKLIRETEKNIAYWDSINQLLPPLPKQQ